MTRPGERDRQIGLQYKTRVSDNMGGWVDTYVTAATVWAKMSTNRTDEAINAMATTGTAIHNINIAYRTDVRSNWRINSCFEDVDLVLQLHIPR